LTDGCRNWKLDTGNWIFLKKSSLIIEAIETINLKNPPVIGRLFR